MHAFWEIVASNSLVVVVLAVGVALLGRHWKNPVGLHLLWVFVLLKLVTPPVFTVRVPLSAYGTPLMAAEQEASRQVIDPSSVEVSREARVAPIAVNRQDQRSPEKRAASESLASPIGVTASAAGGHRMSWLTVLAWTWGAGIALFASGHACRILRFRSLLRGAEAPPSALLSMAEGIGKRLGLRWLPEIALLPLRLSPFVWSMGGRPRVFLPAALFERLDADAQQAILTHELAHVRRKDHWVRLLELVVGTLFWWHPVV
jgi:bla regulator protein blaR1